MKAYYYSLLERGKICFDTIIKEICIETICSKEHIFEKIVYTIENELENDEITINLTVKKLAQTNIGLKAIHRPCTKKQPSKTAFM